MRFTFTFVLIFISLLGFAQKSVDFSNDTPLMNKPLPNFEGTTLDGKKFNLEEHKGKVVVIVFWSLSCAACFKEIPEINRLADEYLKDKVVIVSVMPDTKEDVEKRMHKDGEFYRLNKEIFKNDIIKYEIVIDAKEVMSQYSLEKSFPQSFVVDQQGILRKYSQGYLELWSGETLVEHANYQNFKTSIDKLTKN